MCVGLRKRFFVLLRELRGDGRLFADYPDERLSALMEHLREYSSYSALHRNYEEGGKADDLYESLREELEMRSVDQFTIEELNPAELDKLTRAKQSQQAEELSDYDQITYEKRDQLELKLKRDAEQFERHWREDMPNRYRKPSPRLIALYEMERKLGLSGYFAQAAAAKREVEDLEAREMDAAQRLLFKDYTAAREVFMKNQEEERALFYETRDHWKEVMLARHQIVLERVQNRKNVIVQQREQARAPRESILPSPRVSPAPRDPLTAGNAVLYHRKSAQIIGHLLPALQAPNDDAVKERFEREAEQQRGRARRFREYQARKQALEDVSDASDSDGDGEKEKEKETEVAKGSVSVHSVDDQTFSLTASGQFAGEAAVKEGDQTRPEEAEGKEGDQAGSAAGTPGAKSKPHSAQSSTAESEEEDEEEEAK
jgi:hypothetical protein